MALDLDENALNRRIDQLRSGYEGYSAKLRTRNRTYLRLYSPEFDERLLEHDQWAEPFLAQNVGKARSSFNITRSVVELWTALEAYPFPTFRWNESFLPSALPALDPQENERNIQSHRAQKLVSRRLATMRERILSDYMARARLERHYFRAILRKNLYGHSWLKCMPDTRARRFNFKTSADPSTVYPVWSAWDADELAAILVVTRRSARTLAEQYPDAVPLEDDGTTVASTGFYMPTSTAISDADRTWVWVEDYWLLDRSYEQPVQDGDEPIRSRVICAVRVNGKIVERTEYPGWRTIPYFHFQNDNMRDHLGFSDAGTVGPIQDGINRFLSQQSDVIDGESKPKFKFRSDAGRKIELAPDGIIGLDPDEDIEQIQVHLDTFPTQVHGQQLMDLLARSTGLNDSVWGRIVASQNSGRALATAWRSVASRLVPRLDADGETLHRLVNYMLDTLELYNWDAGRDLYNGNRDFSIDFPNQEPRDFMEVATVAINKLNAGIHDLQAAMEETGENSPDEMIERVRGDYVDPVLHPEKSQSFLLLEQLQQQIALQAQQAGLQAQQIQAQLDQMRSGPPSGAPGGAGPNVAAAEQARTQAAQQAAPTVAPGQGPQPATQAGQTANQTQVSTLVQNGGPAQNRIIRRATYGG